MAELSVKYLGLTLKNPIIAGSSGLTRSIADFKRLEESGVAAIVMKSMFEEQIFLDADYDSKKALQDNLIYFRNSETFDYIDTHVKTQYISDYVETIQRAKEQVNIPVIASINCVTASSWTTFASKLQNAGADALELNIAIQGFNPDISAGDIEKIHLDIIHKVRKEVSIPVAVKISPYFSDLSRMIDVLSNTGINGIVLFNRLFSPDIDLDQMKITATNMFSTPSEMTNSLRWIAMKSELSCDLCASTGIHSGPDVIKMLLAGAAATQIVSTLYNNGIGQVATMLKEIEQWMQKKGYNYIEQFAGKMNQFETSTPNIYERIQFMKYYAQI